MLNRCAVILRYREPMIRWINESDPRGQTPEVTTDSLRNEQTVYLIPEIPVELEKAVGQWIDANFAILFEDELESWYTNRDLWPKNRTRKLFREWFDFEYHSMIIDTVDDDLCDDGE